MSTPVAPIPDAAALLAQGQSMFTSIGLGAVILLVAGFGVARRILRLGKSGVK